METQTAGDRFAQERNAIWIDAWIPPTSELLGDAIHLTPKGESLVADFWFQSLQPIMQLD